MTNYPGYGMRPPGGPQQPPPGQFDPLGQFGAPAGQFGPPPQFGSGGQTGRPQVNGRGVLVIAAVVLLISALAWLPVSILNLLAALTADPFSESDKALLAKLHDYVDATRTLEISYSSVEILGALVLLVGALMLFARNRAGRLLAILGNGIILIAFIVAGFTVLTSNYGEVFNTEDGRPFLLALSLLAMGLTLLPPVGRVLRPGRRASGGMPPGYSHGNGMQVGYPPR